MERQTNLDQADRSLPNPNDSRRAPVCFDGTGKTDPDMLVGGLFPREDQRSTRTDVTKLTRNGVELLACPPADVGFIRGSRMTGRRAAVGRLDWGTFSPTGVLLGGRDPAQSKEQATDSGHCLQRCQAVEQQQEFLVFRPSSIEPVLEADLSGASVEVGILLDEPEPSGKPDLSVIGIPGSSSLVSGSSASVRFHDRPSVIMDSGWVK